MIRWRSLCGACAVATALLVAAASADELALKSGRTYQGLLVEKDDQSVLFTIYTAGGGKMTVRYAMSQVAELKVDGKEPVFQKPAPKPIETTPPPPPPEEHEEDPQQEVKAGPAPAAPAQDAAPPAAGRTTRTPAEVNQLIDQTGRTPPDWWDSVPLNYPRTLDLIGTYTSKQWEPQKKLGAHFFSIITPNPSRWRGGIRLLHHVLSVRKDDPPRLAEAMNMLANSYRTYEKDYARAAFWHRKATEKTDQLYAHPIVGLAECYYRLGSASMASAQLSRYGLDRQPFTGAIKLWAEMGQTKLALSLAQGYVSAGRAAEGCLYAADILRKLGRYDEALGLYEKSLDAARRAPRGPQRIIIDRATGSIEAIKLYEALDLRKVADGTHRATVTSYRGPLEVEVVVAGGRIVSARVARHKDDIFFTSITDVPRQIVETQGVKDIDAVSGATVTSMAIINAAAKALAGGMR